MAVGLLCLAAAAAYLQRNCLGVAESTIRGEFGLTKHQSGWILSAFFWTYAIFQIPSGWLADRWGSRRTLSLYAVLWSVATVLMVFAGTWATDVFPESFEWFGLTLSAALIWLLVTRLLGGAAQAGVFPCSAIIISDCVPEQKRGMATAWLGAFQQVGFVLALVLTGWLLSGIGWRWTFAAYSIPGFLWAVFFFRRFRDGGDLDSETETASIRVDEADSSPRQETHRREKPSPVPWLQLVSSPAMWLIAGQQFCRGAGYIFYATWFPTFLQETRNVSVEKSGELTAMTILAALAGALLGGMVSDWVLSRTGRQRLARQGLAVLGMLLCAGFIVLAFFVEDVVLAVAVISAGSFCASLAGPPGYTVTIGMGGKHVATVFGTMNMAGNVGAALFPILVPYLLDLPGGWDLVLFVFAGLYLVAAVFWALLDANGSVFDQALIRSDS